MGIGKRIKEARENERLTQGELAELVGVTPSAITNYEKETSHPKEPIMYKLLDALKIDANYLFQDVVTVKYKFNADYKEQELIKKYRALDDHGKENVNITLDRESKRFASIIAKDTRIAELEAAQTAKEQTATLIELQPYRENTSSIPYFRGGVSAGNGVFVLGNEATDELEIPDIPKYKDVDYALDVNGVSMEPDYTNGDIVLVSHEEEMRPGDIGVFIIDGSAYIKELGHTELISRNKDFPNISLHKGNNIVCMGKVMGKFEKV